MLIHCITGPSNRQIRIQRSNSSPRRLQPPPQPCRTLREQQVLELQKEIKHPAGVRLQIRKKDCISSIALGDALGGVWYVFVLIVRYLLFIIVSY